MSSEWQTIKIEDAILINPLRPLPKGVNAPFVAMEGLVPFQRDIEMKQDREYRGSVPRFMNGDTLFARITPCLENGKTALISDLPQNIVGHGSTEFIVMSGKGNISDSLFVYYLARDPNFRSYAIQKMEGTSGRQRVPVSALSNLIIELPPLPEQRAIAYILGTLDDKIELNRRMNQTMEAMAQALFKSWFGDFEPFRDQGMQKSALGEIPVGWQCVYLADIITLDKGVSYKGQYLAAEGIPMINLGCFLGHGEFSSQNVKYYCGEYRARHTVSPGDIVIANTDITQKREVLGSPAIVPVFRENANCIFTHHVYALRFPEKMSQLKQFVYLALLQPNFRERAIGFATGTTVLALPRDTILGYQIAVPDDTAIRLFNEHVEPVFAMLHANVEQSTGLASIRDALLPKLLSGEIRVKDAEKFVGSKL